MIEEYTINELNKCKVGDIIDIDCEEQPISLEVNSSEEIYENLNIPCTECFFRNRLECLDLHCVLRGVYYKQLNDEE